MERILDSVCKKCNGTGRIPWVLRPEEIIPCYSCKRGWCDGKLTSIGYKFSSSSAELDEFTVEKMALYEIELLGRLHQMNPFLDWNDFLEIKSVGEMPVWVYTHYVPVPKEKYLYQGE